MEILNKIDFFLNENTSGKLREYMKDPLYKAVIDAYNKGDGKELKKALDTLSSVRGKSALADFRVFLKKYMEKR